MGQNLEEGVRGKLGTLSPDQETGSELLVNIRTQKENKWIDFVWAHHCQVVSRQSKFLFNRNRKFYFLHKHLRMGIVELYYEKAKGEYLNPGCLPTCTSW